LTYFGYYTFFDFRRLSAGVDPDCFINLGAYKICDLTQKLSINGSLFVLMVQALVSRMIVPGMSNFVNASVMRLLPRACDNVCLSSCTMMFCEL
jgi:hypothetical protein